MLFGEIRSHVLMLNAADVVSLYLTIRWRECSDYY